MRVNTTHYTCKDQGTAGTQQEQQSLGQLLLQNTNSRARTVEKLTVLTPADVSNTITVVILSLQVFSYRVQPNPAEGKGELHVLRHCVRQPAQLPATNKPSPLE